MGSVSTVIKGITFMEKKEVNLTTKQARSNDDKPDKSISYVNEELKGGKVVTPSPVKPTPSVTTDDKPSKKLSFAKPIKTGAPDTPSVTIVKGPSVTTADKPEKKLSNINKSLKGGKVVTPTPVKPTPSVTTGEKPEKKLSYAKPIETGVVSEKERIRVSDIEAAKAKAKVVDEKKVEEVKKQIPSKATAVTVPPTPKSTFSPVENAPTTTPVNGGNKSSLLKTLGKPHVRRLLITAVSMVAAGLVGQAGGTGLYGFLLKRGSL